MSDYKLSHLQELEAESIHIIREVAAEFENPVMLYSIGKDSSVMVRLAEKAFAPGKVPFPLMHIDSKWKFKEMIEFRDSYAAKYGWNLIVESNMEAFRAGVGPFSHGSKVHTDLMKTQALLQALDKYKFDAAFGGARRDEEKSRAKERIFSFRDKFHQWDPKNQRQCRMGRCLKRCRNARKLFYLAPACLGIQALYIAPFTLFKRCADIHFQEIILADNGLGHLAKLVVGADKGGNRDDATIDKQLAHLGNTADVLHTVGGRKAQVVVDATTDVVAIQNAAEQSALV